MMAAVLTIGLMLLLLSSESPRPPTIADNRLDTFAFTPWYRRASSLADSSTLELLPQLNCDRCVQPTVDYPVYVGPPPPADSDPLRTISDSTRGRSAELDSPYVLRVHDSSVWVDGNGRFGKGATQWVLPGACEWMLGPDSTWWLFRFYDWLVRPRYNKAVVLTQRWSAHYYHFLLESMPRLALLPAATLADPEQVFIIQALKYPKQQMELIRWLGLESRLRVLEGEHWTAAVSDELTIPQPCACGSCNPKVLLAFKAMLFTQTWLKELTEWNMPHAQAERRADGSEPTPLPPRHVLWMQRLGDRGVSNDAGLLSIARRAWPAAQFHFHTSALSLEATARLFYQCDTIVGPHGAGWANLIFTRPGFKSIEFLPQHFSNQLYAQISLILGGRRHNFITAPGATKDTVMHIPTDLFAQAVKL